MNEDVAADAVDGLLRFDAVEEEVPDGDHVAAANAANRVDGGHGGFGRSNVGAQRSVAHLLLKPFQYSFRLGGRAH